jgi:hypothetical protein
MKTLAIKLLGILAASAVVSGIGANAQTMESTRFTALRWQAKDVNLAKGGDFVSLYGRWRATTPGRAYVAPLNKTTVSCDKSAKRCIEALAMIQTWGLDTKVGELHVTTFEYEITEWSATLIRAIERDPHTDFELRISLTDRTAERSARGTSARGSKMADPKEYRHWVLE